VGAHADWRAFGSHSAAGSAHADWRWDEKWGRAQDPPHFALVWGCAEGVGLDALSYIDRPLSRKSPIALS
jgi:hypothetical protein